jgi:integrase
MALLRPSAEGEAGRAERGKKPGSKVSPATVNRELRHVKAFLRVAHDWGYLPAVPKVRMVREPEKIGPVMTPEHFQAIYAACDSAGRPGGLPCPPAEWWRAMLTFLLTTGWRIEEALAFRRDDLDLATGRIVTRTADNKRASATRRITCLTWP